jgi:glutamyl-tRNA(Gln) amidotransferase subunit E
MRCGIEIHQRLATKSKLFCDCSARISNEEPIGVVIRKQKAVAGELGEIDAAALHEFSAGRTYVYQVFPSSTCLVETDSEPPHPLNQEALDIVVEIALLLNAKIVDEVEVMRKTVIDGSNTCGFQRTAIVALDGFIETSKGRIAIPTICLEEESSGIVGEEKGKVTYRLDRLGIPLIEIATSSDIKNPAHAKETAEKLGMLLRVAGKVQRGIGTIRQDVNVSVEGGARVEVKGAQELGLIPTIVEKEVKRQEGLIKIKEELAKRFGKSRLGKGEVVEVTGIFSKTGSKFIAKGIGRGMKVFAVKLEKFSGLLGMELYENRRFGTELSDYAKANADVGGIIHSDEEPERYGITSKEVEELKKKLSIKENDAFVIVVDEGSRATKALGAVYERVLQAFEGAQKEVRKVLPDGGTSYMRPLPGSSRLYPETDIPPVKITKERIEKIGRKLPETVEERKTGLLKLLNEELANKLLVSENLRLFEMIVDGIKVDPVLVATTLEETVISLRRAGIPVENLSEEKLFELFKEYKGGRFVKAAIPEILSFIAKNPSKKIDDGVRELKLDKIFKSELEKIVKKTLEESKGDKKLAFNRIMSEHRLRVEAKEVMTILKI